MAVWRGNTCCERIYRSIPIREGKARTTAPRESGTIGTGNALRAITEGTYAENEPIANNRASVAFGRVGDFERVIATTISARLKDDGIRPVIYPAHSDPQSRARAQATPGHFPLAFHAHSLPFLEAALRRVLFCLLANLVFVYLRLFPKISLGNRGPTLCPLCGSQFTMNEEFGLRRSSFWFLLLEENLETVW